MSSACRAVPRLPLTARFAGLLPLFLAAACAGCGDQEEKLVEAARAPVKLTAGDRAVTVELALTEEQRQHGLMHRTHLDPDAGMLFIWPDDGPRTFWMKNTLIGLDIVFLDKDGTVQNVAQGLPGVEKPGYHSARPARMVLELNSGWCREHGLDPGERVLVPDGLLALAKK